MGANERAGSASREIKAGNRQSEVAHLAAEETKHTTGGAATDSEIPHEHAMLPTRTTDMVTGGGALPHLHTHPEVIRHHLDLVPFLPHVRSMGDAYDELALTCGPPRIPQLWGCDTWPSCGGLGPRLGSRGTGGCCCARWRHGRRRVSDLETSHALLDLGGGGGGDLPEEEGCGDARWRWVSHGGAEGARLVGPSGDSFCEWEGGDVEGGWSQICTGASGASGASDVSGQLGWNTSSRISQMTWC